MGPKCLQCCDPSPKIIMNRLEPIALRFFCLFTFDGSRGENKYFNIVWCGQMQIWRFKLKINSSSGERDDCELQKLPGLEHFYVTQSELPFGFLSQKVWIDSTIDPTQYTSSMKKHSIKNWNNTIKIVSYFRSASTSFFAAFSPSRMENERNLRGEKK